VGIYFPEKMATSKSVGNRIPTDTPK